MSEESRAAQKSIDLALIALKRGDVAEAADHLTSALKSDPRNPDAYYHLARLYGIAGRDETAAQVFQLAIDTLPHEFLSARTFVRYQGNSFDARTTRNFFAALAKTTPVLQNYLAPSQWLGRHGPALTPQQDEAIAGRLDDAWSAFVSGRTALPSSANAFLSRQRPLGAAWPRTLVFMPRYVASNPDFVTSTYAAHTVASLAELGIASDFHAADHLCFDSRNPDCIWTERTPNLD